MKPKEIEKDIKAQADKYFACPDDLISRKAALSKIYRVRTLNGPVSVVAVGDIKDLPSAEVKGQWVRNIHDVIICSECGAEFHQWYDEYCAHCGADMRKEQE